eukprot:375725_1
MAASQRENDNMIRLMAEIKTLRSEIRTERFLIVILIAILAIFWAVTQSQLSKHVDTNIDKEYDEMETRNKNLMDTISKCTQKNEQLSKNKEICDEKLNDFNSNIKTLIDKIEQKETSEKEAIKDEVNDNNGWNIIKTISDKVSSLINTITETNQEKK